MKVIKINEIDNTLPSKFINNEGLNVAVVNAQIASELQMMSPFKPTLTPETITPGEVYFLGMCGGYYVYVDPNLAWNNTIITLCETIDDYNC